MTLYSDPNTVDILLLINNKSNMHILQLSICVVVVQTKRISKTPVFRFVDRVLIKALVKEKRRNKTKVFETLMSGLQVPPHVV